MPVSTECAAALLYLLDTLVRNFEWNLRQFWNITSGMYAKYHVKSCYYLFILLPTKAL